VNTLTLIPDTDGNLFCGFTLMKWESGDKWKGDDRLRSFLFRPKKWRAFCTETGHN
jgi:hypothetical protein